MNLVSGRTYADNLIDAVGIAIELAPLPEARKGEQAVDWPRFGSRPKTHSARILFATFKRPAR
jgi:hypothetical protein